MGSRLMLDGIRRSLFGPPQPDGPAASVGIIAPPFSHGNVLDHDRKAIQPLTARLAVEQLDRDMGVVSDQIGTTSDKTRGRNFDFQ